MSTLPLTFAYPNWFTTRFIAARLGKDITTVQKWIRSGLLTRMGYVVAITRDSEGKRYWVHIPTAVRSNGMLRRVLANPLDTSATSPLPYESERSISRS